MQMTGFVYNQFYSNPMIPAYQMLPNSLPFFNLCEMGGIQYLVPYAPLNFNSCPTTQFSLLPLAYFSRTLPHQELMALSEDRSSDTSFHKPGNL